MGGGREYRNDGKGKVRVYTYTSIKKGLKNK